MNELIPILETLVTEAEAGRPAALCTIVKTSGSVPRLPGTAMVVRSDGTTVGTVGGGLVEVQTRQIASRWLRENHAGRFDSALDYDDDSDEGMICGGQVQIAIMPVSTTAQLEPIKPALAAAHQRQPASLPLAIEHEGKLLTYRLHLETSPTLVVAGAGHVGQAVAQLGVELGFHVVVIDDRAGAAARERFGEPVELIVGDIPQTLRDYSLDQACYVVIVTRGHRYDQQALEAVVGRPAAYVGMMGSRRKVAAVLKALTQAGVSQELLDRVHTPIGISIGALTVPELAVSIFAEVIQVRRQTTPKLIEGPM